MSATPREFSDTPCELLHEQLQGSIQDCLLELIHTPTPDKTLSRLLSTFGKCLNVSRCDLVKFETNISCALHLAQIEQPGCETNYYDYLVSLDKIADKALYYSITDDDSKLLFPLIHQKCLHGGLVISCHPELPMTNETLLAISAQCPTLAKILENICLANTQRRDDLYEERAAISRELHDSLAQSLTYLKIQATRLQAVLPELTNHGVASEILEELKTNLNSAYRQLRELMTTFRLTMHGKSFKLAVKDSIDEFSKYNNIVFELNDNCPQDILTVDEEMQILQIVREALYNIVRHSQASKASVSLTYKNPQLVIRIKDNGVGFDFHKKDQRHHGLIIMQERAFRLNGKMKIYGTLNKGTQINIPFTPKLAQ